MMSFAVLLLCAVSGHTFGSTLKPVQEVDMEDAIHSFSKKMSNTEEKLLLLLRKEMAEEMRKLKYEVLLECQKVETRFLSAEEMQKVKAEILEEFNKTETRFILQSTESAEEIQKLKDEISEEANKTERKLVLQSRESAEEMQKLKAEILKEVKKTLAASVDNIKELSTGLEHVLIRMSEIENTSKVAFNNVSDRLLVDKNKLLMMDNHLLLEVHQLQKKAFETFEKIANVEHDVSRDRERADLLEVRLNGTANMTHSCLASQTEMEETMKKNIETLKSNLSDRMGIVENSLETLRKDISYVSDRQDANLKFTVQNNTNDISKINKELSRIHSICNPPCENGGQCVKNVCNCTPFFTGDRCQKASCGTDFDNAGSDGGKNISSVLVWPWMAAVYRISDTKHVCSGSVIHRHFVLTSAWCVKEYESAGLSVKLGLSDLKKGTHLQEHRVQSSHVHPQFKTGSGRLDNNLHYDIGLLELEEPITFGPFVRPVCLSPPGIPQDELFYKPQSTAKAVYISEYLSSPETAFPTLLNLTVLSQEECSRKIKENEWEIYYPSPDLSFCAEGSSKCPDEGSPLMQSRLAGNGARTWTQVGISDCENKYFTSPRLYYLREWVENTIAASARK